MGYDKPLNLYEDMGYVLMAICFDLMCAELIGFNAICYELICFVCTPLDILYICALDMYEKSPTNIYYF
jgi:hypothetical protein